MILYLAIIFISMAITVVVNLFVLVIPGAMPLWIDIALVVGIVAALFAGDALVAFILHKFPKKAVNPYLKFYAVSKRERNFYNFLRIRKWKDIIPEMGKYLCDFDKRKVGSGEPEYIFMFLEETCYAEIIHIAMCFISPIVILIVPFQYFLSFSLPLCTVNFFLQIPPILTQRFNRPRLLLMYEKSLRERQAAVSDQS